MYDEGADTYTPSYNPEFVRRARANVRRRQAEREAQERMRRRMEAEQRLEAIKKARQNQQRVKAAKRKITAEERFSGLIKMLDSRREVPLSASIHVTDIIAVVAAKHGFTVADMRGRSRNKQIVAARHEAIAEVRRLKPELSMPKIGELFGGRDHTSILHALRKAGAPTKAVREAA